VSQDADDWRLVRRIDAVLPQTQCTRCGYDDCQAYAQAIARDHEAINRCPPGGAAGIERLAALTGRAIEPLDPECGVHTPLQQAVIDEHWCIGCTLCIKACPVDCIVGTHKQMHTVIAAQCTGCELCVPVCPVDCIRIEPAPRPAWTDADAALARQRYHATQVRRSRARDEHADALAAKAEHKLAHLETLTQADGEAELQRKRDVIEAALARARSQRSTRS
jgi:electron transport complex protein RnfB